MELEVRFETGQLQRILLVARNEIANPERILRSLGEELFRVNTKRHNAGLDPDGRAWAPLSQVTLSQGKRKGGPLKKTGRMLGSFHPAVVGDTLILGFDEPRIQGRLPSIHNAGTEKTGRHPGIPKRALIGFPLTDQELIKNVTNAHFKHILNGI
ncbi:MAG: hypothetical protein CTY34_02050 [Methylobacter sp.]|nr:MAG: hypothetical protein CTY34_02050 [Methylobacter sp.]